MFCLFWADSSKPVVDQQISALLSPLLSPSQDIAQESAAISWLELEQLLSLWSPVFSKSVKLKRWAFGLQSQTDDENHYVLHCEYNHVSVCHPLPTHTHTPVLRIHSKITYIREVRKTWLKKVLKAWRIEGSKASLTLPSTQTVGKPLSGSPFPGIPSTSIKHLPAELQKSNVILLRYQPKTLASVIWQYWYVDSSHNVP